MPKHSGGDGGLQWVVKKNLQWVEQNVRKTQW